MQEENKKADQEAGDEGTVRGMSSSLLDDIKSGGNTVWAKEAWALFSPHKLGLSSLEWGVGVSQMKGKYTGGDLLKVKGARCVGVSVSEMKVLIKVAAVCPSLIRKFARLATGAQDFAGES